MKTSQSLSLVHGLKRLRPTVGASCRFRSPRVVVGLIAAIGLTLSGCGNGRPETYSVTGMVTYQGKPVEGASVMFMPKAARPASAITDAQGGFALRSFTENDGAVAGEQAVCIAKNRVVPGKAGDPPGKINAVPVLPVRYGTPTTSPLKATITAGGPNEFRFDLTD